MEMSEIYGKRLSSRLRNSAVWLPKTVGVRGVDSRSVAWAATATRRVAAQDRAPRSAGAVRTFSRGAPAHIRRWFCTGGRAVDTLYGVIGFIHAHALRVSGLAA